MIWDYVLANERPKFVRATHDYTSFPKEILSTNREWREHGLTKWTYRWYNNIPDYINWDLDILLAPHCFHDALEYDPRETRHERQAAKVEDFKKIKTIVWEWDDDCDNICCQSEVCRWDLESLEAVIILVRKDGFEFEERPLLPPHGMVRIQRALHNMKRRVRRHLEQPKPCGHGVHIERNVMGVGQASNDEDSAHKADGGHNIPKILFAWIDYNEFRNSEHLMDLDPFEAVDDADESSS